MLQAVMDEHEENREKGNLTAEILNREKVLPYYFSKVPLFVVALYYMLKPTPNVSPFYLY